MDEPYHEMKGGSEILIVEDSPTQSEQLKHILERNGYLVSATRNGREAIAAIETHPPALVISDIVMPEMDGYQLCRHIKSDAKHGEIPVILLTSLSDPVDIISGLECGADNFLFKPCEEEHLLARISTTLGSRLLPNNEVAETGVDITYANRNFTINSDRRQILNLLLSTYEAAVHRNRELTVARDEMRHMNELLEQRVLERTAALEAEVTERRRTEEEVRRLNAELEQRVAERTARLEAVNAELEAFSYSVSHDLRAPLRHINGFITLLVESPDINLPERSRRYLDIIVKATKKMGQLIDDLLVFSRMGRAPLKVGTVELQALVEEAIGELDHETAGRNIVWRHTPLPVVTGDRALLRQVFANLIGNAVKYTGPRDPAEIEIGSTNGTAGEATIYIRDNGVGFDMKYADKLFGVFQRLHRDEDFEGTGIGLANVRRIIARHGGRTWAEASIDSGATFYFSLPIRSDDDEHA